MKRRPDRPRGLVAQPCPTTVARAMIRRGGQLGVGNRSSSRPKRRVQAIASKSDGESAAATGAACWMTSALVAGKRAAGGRRVYVGRTISSTGSAFGHGPAGEGRPNRPVAEVCGPLPPLSPLRYIQAGAGIAQLVASASQLDVAGSNRLPAPNTSPELRCASLRLPRRKPPPPFGRRLSASRADVSWIPEQSLLIPSKQPRREPMYLCRGEMAGFRFRGRDSSSRCRGEGPVGRGPDRRPLRDVLL